MGTLAVCVLYGRNTITNIMMYTYVYVCICTYMYTYIHIHMSTYMSYIYVYLQFYIPYICIEPLAGLHHAWAVWRAGGRSRRRARRPAQSSACRIHLGVMWGLLEKPVGPSYIHTHRNVSLSQCAYIYIYIQPSWSRKNMIFERT